MRSSLLGLVFAVACGGGGEAGSDAGLGEADGGLSLDAAEPADAAEPTPILERAPPGLSVTCTLDQVIDVEPRAWGSPVLAATSTEAWIVRSEDGRETISPITSSAELGAPIYRQDGSDFTALAVRAGTLYFAAGGPASVRLLELDRRGLVNREQSIYVRSDAARIAIAFHGEETAVAWSGFADPAVGLVIAGGGTPVIAERFERVRSFTPIALIAVPDGYRLFWEAAGAVRTVAFDRAGAMRSEPAVLAEPSRGDSTLFDEPQIAAVALEDGALVAWVESYWNGKDYNAHIRDLPPLMRDPTGEAWSVIRVARLDGNGAIVDSARLAAPRLHVDAVEPRLTRAGDRVILDWSEGEHLYSCSGCFPDHRQRMVWLDPYALAPVSAVVEATVPSGGLMRRSSVFFERTFLTAARIQYHATMSHALTTFTCEE